MGMLKMQHPDEITFQSINFNFYTTSAVLQVSTARGQKDCLPKPRLGSVCFDMYRWSSFSCLNCAAKGRALQLSSAPHVRSEFRWIVPETLLTQTRRRSVSVSSRLDRTRWDCPWRRKPALTLVHRATASSCTSWMTSTSRRYSTAMESARHRTSSCSDRVRVGLSSVFDYVRESHVHAARTELCHID